MNTFEQYDNVSYINDRGVRRYGVARYFERKGFVGVLHKAGYTVFVPVANLTKV